MGVHSWALHDSLGALGMNPPAITCPRLLATLPRERGSPPANSRSYCGAPHRTVLDQRARRLVCLSQPATSARVARARGRAPLVPADRRERDEGGRGAAGSDHFEACWWKDAPRQQGCMPLGSIDCTSCWRAATREAGRTRCRGEGDKDRPPLPSCPARPPRSVTKPRLLVPTSDQSKDGPALSSSSWCRGRPDRPRQARGAPRLVRYRPR